MEEASVLLSTGGDGRPHSLVITLAHCAPRALGPCFQKRAVDRSRNGEFVARYGYSSDWLPGEFLCLRFSFSVRAVRHCNSTLLGAAWHPSTSPFRRADFSAPESLSRVP